MSFCLWSDNPLHFQVHFSVALYDFYYNETSIAHGGVLLKILIIEDEKLLADTVGALLRHKGFDVEIVYDGESGAQYAGAWRL